MSEMAFPQTHPGMISALEFVEAAVVGSDPELVDRAVLVAGEVLANAVEHNGEDVNLSLEVKVEWTDRQLDVTIRESSRGVDMASMERATLPTDPLSTSGRGLFLIWALVDNVEPVGDSGVRYSFCVRDAP